MAIETPTMVDWRDSSLFSGSQSAYLEELYEAYLADPSSISPKWRSIFDALPGSRQGDVSHLAIQQQFAELVKHGPQTVVVEQGDALSTRVQALIEHYRMHGHEAADLDPLGLTKRPPVAALDLAKHGLADVDLKTVVSVGDFGDGSDRTLGQLIADLKAVYSNTIAVEYMDLVSEEQRLWVQSRIESRLKAAPLDVEVQKRILERLTAAEGLERYLGSRYPGAKRFSLEGGDSLIVMLDRMFQLAADKGVKDINIGMAHRGRLTVLVSVLGKKPSDLFSEFEGKYTPGVESGDVKYHQGFSSDVQTAHGPMHLNLAFNPSHLAIVTPVVMGSVKARQIKRQDESRDQIIPIALHGDAAFAGQGVIMEVLNMSQTRGYGVGGTLHIVINNQVGFTTSHPEDSRSTPYCTDVAKMIQSPVFHVNADDVESVFFVAQMAFDFRMAFHKDVVIDLSCYRRHGHNEADEPTMTQPIMYQKIKQHPTARDIYARQLEEKARVPKDYGATLVNENRDMLDQGNVVARDLVSGDSAVATLFDWTPYLKQDWRLASDTRLDKATYQSLIKPLTEWPADVTPHARVAKTYQDRKAMMAGEQPMDWGCGETLGFASLLAAGYNIRLSGQDCGRGTFSHRHSVIHDQANGSAYVPLNHLSEKQGTYTVIDSLLSEEAVLAYEYGFASTDPETLTIWEGQFGDFVNGAQVVIDQFISSGEQKWGRQCGLVMLLPHGYEGQGPEHSSARLERFMQLCAQYNMQVCVPSTPAQIFHVLRRQMLRKIRRPLVIMSPKSLLRHKLAVSTPAELTDGQFSLVIDDNTLSDTDAKSINRIVLSSGKVYYDLFEGRRDMKHEMCALVRVEQLYPFPEEELKQVMARYPNATEVVWCQEEPKNQGAWYSSQHHFHACLRPNQTLRYAGRPASASPAVGYPSMHQQQQNELVYDALN